MTEKTLAEMTESELREIIEDKLKQVKNPVNRAKIRIGVVELEFEGTEEFVSRSVRRHLASLSASSKLTPAKTITEYDFEKDKTIALGPGPEDFGERAEEILADNATQHGWTLKKDSE
jgi:hypothetical protein